MDDALHLYFKKERLDGADYKCERCRMKVPATKKFFIDEAPLILCVQLKRYGSLPVFILVFSFIVPSFFQFFFIVRWFI